MDRFHVPSVDVVASNALIDYFLSEDMFLPADAYPPSADMDDGDHASIPRDANVENAVKEGFVVLFFCWFVPFIFWKTTSFGCLGSHHCQKGRCCSL